MILPSGMVNIADSAMTIIMSVFISMLSGTAWHIEIRMRQGVVFLNMEKDMGRTCLVKS